MEPKQLCIISKEHRDSLLKELQYLDATVLGSTDSCIWLAEDRVEPAWAQCVWRDIQTLDFKSITDAKKKLKAISKRWNYFGDELNRRGALIVEGLTPKKAGSIEFPTPLPALPAFTLLDTGRLAYSLRVQRPTESGEIFFKENKKIPPSRAYLKLWEAFSILGKWPQAGESVIELGASPGSWSWALAELGANVLSVDRSPLHENLSRYPNIRFQKGDAFSLEPQKTDWLVSDVICFPGKLLEYVTHWFESGQCQKFICTLKFTGTPDPSIVDRFRRLPHSRVLHLFHNKNEVTWICDASVVSR